MRRLIHLVAFLAFLPISAAQTPPTPAPVVRSIQGVDALDVKEADIFTLSGVDAKDYALVNVDVFPTGALTVQKFITGSNVVLFVKASKAGLAAVFVDVNAPPFCLLKKEIQVGGATPPNPPEPGPDDGKPKPGTKQQLVVWLRPNSQDDLPTAQRYLLSLAWAQKLAKSGHKLLGVLTYRDGETVRGDVAAFQAAVDGVELPAIAAAPLAGGDVVTFPAPKTESEFWVRVGKP